MENYKDYDISTGSQRAKDGDQGLNTGGMGTFSPQSFIQKKVDESVRSICLLGNRVMPWQQKEESLMELFSLFNVNRRRTKRFLNIMQDSVILKLK